MIRNEVDAAQATRQHRGAGRSVGVRAVTGIDRSGAAGCPPDRGAGLWLDFGVEEIKGQLDATRLRDQLLATS